jgi:hypothetical protein
MPHDHSHCSVAATDRGSLLWRRVRDQRILARVIAAVNMFLRQRAFAVAAELSGYQPSKTTSSGKVLHPKTTQEDAT